MISTESVMTLKWQLLVARSGISTNRLSLYPSQEQSVCRVLDRRSGFCTEIWQPKWAAAPARWLPGRAGLGLGLCSGRRLHFLRQLRVILAVQQLPDWEHSSGWAAAWAALCTTHWDDFKMLCASKMPGSNASPVSGCSTCKVTAHTSPWRGWRER